MNRQEAPVFEWSDTVICFKTIYKGSNKPERKPICDLSVDAKSNLKLLHLWQNQNGFSTILCAVSISK